MLMFLPFFILGNVNNNNKSKGLSFFMFSLALTTALKLAYVQPAAQQYDEIFFRSGSGNGASDIQIYRPGLRSRGRSLLGVISALAKRAIPFLGNYVLPEASQFLGGLIQDITLGRPVKSSLKSQAKKSVKRVFSKVARGKGAGWARGRGRGWGRGLGCAGRDVFDRMKT